MHLIPSSPGPQRPISLIVVHCSATPSGKALAGGSPDQVIDRWHAERGFKRDPVAARGWRSDLKHIGYHYVIGLDGLVYAGRGLDEPGAHAVGHNAKSVGICLVGGAERLASYTRAQWHAAAEVVRALATGLRLPLTRSTLCGHRDLSPDTNGNGQVEPREWLKTCPGFDVSEWRMNGFKPFPAQVVEVA